MDQGFDMTASMHADLLRMCKGDKEKAKQMVSGLKGQMEEEKQRAQQRKIDELTANFPSINRDALVKILTENDWDVEKAILPCFEFQEKEREAQRQKEREEQNKKREEERRARQAEARQQAKTFLVQLFSNVPEEKIQAMLEENEGDVDLTTDQLISMKAEEEEKQEEMLKRRKEEEEQLKRQAELGSLILTHLYLLVGCAAPVWLYSPTNPSEDVHFLLPYLGVLLVGLGDSFASLAGMYLGRIKWPNTKKTVEGTMAAVAVVILAGLLLSLFYPFVSLSFGQWLGFAWAVVCGCLLEAFTTQIDNLALPLYAYAVLCFSVAA